MVFQEKLFNVPESARECRCSEWSIWNYLRLGLLARTRIGGKTFIRESELKKLAVDEISRGNIVTRARRQPKAAAESRSR